MQGFEIDLSYENYCRVYSFSTSFVSVYDFEGMPCKIRKWYNQYTEYIYLFQFFACRHVFVINIDKFNSVSQTCFFHSRPFTGALFTLHIHRRGLNLPRLRLDSLKWWFTVPGGEILLIMAKIHEIHISLLAHWISADLHRAHSLEFFTHSPPVGSSFAVIAGG